MFDIHIQTREKSHLSYLQLLEYKKDKDQGRRCKALPFPVHVSLRARPWQAGEDTDTAPSSWDGSTG